ncbi:MAG TPA: multicopper oxidase domain-containing protein [Gemmatimonadaceae bacterium]|nr:multicopper oxidase domain-containing protein [Gemmatimonadaceae bacterium]
MGIDPTAAAAVVPVGVSPALTKYVDLLPVPTAANGFTYAPYQIILPGVDPNYPLGVERYNIPVSAFRQALHRDFENQGKLTYLWGYGGTFPSRTIEAKVGMPIEITWVNNLRPSDPHPLAAFIDRVNVDGMMDMVNNIPWPDQRITTHLHGGHVPWKSDGGPKTWYTGPVWANGGNAYVPGSQTLHGDFNVGETYYYPNNQPGTTLWYHDHAMGITRYNVIAGMAGFWLLRDPEESQLNLPSGAYEVPIVIQDRIFDVNGQLWYPPAPATPEFFGDTFVVNGKAWPRLKVEPRKYRFRFLNGCNARFLRMQFVKATAAELLPSTRSWATLPFTQIGAEGGFFAAPAAPATVMLLAPAERADVIVDFTGVPAGTKYILYNDAATPFSGTTDTRGAIPEVMIFDVSLGLTGSDTSVVPAAFTLPSGRALGGFVDEQGNAAAPNLAVATSVPKVLTEIALPNGMLMQLINGTGYDRDPITGAPSPAEQVTLGTTEIWQFVNATVDTHPIHLHQTMFQVLDRQKIGISQYMSKVGKGKAMPDPTPYTKGPAIPAGPDEQGWKETIRANPGEVTRIAIAWKGWGGHYVYHCHILEHEEHDMMRALDVNPVPAV